MPRDNISKNQFQGMNQDRHPSLSDFTSYWLARNLIKGNRDSKGFGLSLEPSNDLFADVGTDVIGTGYCDERDWTIYFKSDDSIHLMNHADGEIKEIMNAAEFGCEFGFSDCEWIGGSVQFKTMDPCRELHMYFSSGCEGYKINIDQMLDPERKSGLIAELACDTKCGFGDNCEYFKITKTGCAPTITPIAYNGGGGNVKAGSYVFLIRLKHTDGGETNWFHHSDSVNIGSEHNIAGEEAMGYIDVNISGLDCKFAKAEIAVIETIGGITTAKTLNVVNFGNNTYTHRYTGNDGIPIDLTDLLIKENTYIQPRYMFQKDGRMLYYGIKSRRNPNWQPKVDNIQTEWVVREFAYSDVKKYGLKGFMGGETYAFAAIPNFADGMHGKAFHITATPGSGGMSGDQESSVSENFKERVNDNVGLLSTDGGAGQSQPTLGQARLVDKDEIVRTRMPAEDDSVSNPQDDDLDIIIEALVNDMDTDMSDDLCAEIQLREDYLGAGCCNCSSGGITPILAALENISNYTPTYIKVMDEDFLLEVPGDGTPCGGGSASQKCDDEAEDIETAIGNYGDIIAGGIEDDLDPTTNSTEIYEGAQAIVDAVKRRERVKREKREYNISKTVTYSSTGGGESTLFAGPLFDANGNNITEVPFTEIASGATEPDLETNITYPCITDCNGEFIYALHGQPVAHHKFPDSSEQTHFVSKALGVPYGKYWGDAGEESDLYVRLLGVRFTNIDQLAEDEVSVPLCPNNPFTIGMVKRTPSNKKILVKGLATGTFAISNNGKSYDHPRHGLNSLETVSFYHDDGDGGRLASGDGTSHTIYSLDGLTLRPSVAGDTINLEQELSGAGERYGLYAKGTAPQDELRGSRKDALGARQSINLSNYSPVGSEHVLGFSKYAKLADSTSPGASGGNPLMNKSGQECIWARSGMPQITDESFTGDVLQHNAPIEDARGQYVSIRRNLDDQYGNLENMNYIPLLQAGPNHTTGIEGIVGDTYTGLFSFVKTGFVSDKVGSCLDDDKFNIPAMVDTKMEKRCICDGPEDVVFQKNGAWMWMELPEDGEAADPKNWAGTHTIIASETQKYDAAVGNDPISDFYFPGTVTTNNSYVGQFETCPWLREKSDFLERQWYPEIKSDFRFDSGVSVDANINGWKDSFLNQFHREIEQPALIKKIIKTIVRTTLNIIFPMWGVDNLFDVANGGAQFVGNLAEFPIMIALWYVMFKVLFTNKAIDKLLGIPVCKDDIAGGFTEGFNRGLFFNNPRYNADYSKQSDLYSYEGVPDPYYVCDCDDCDKENYTNEIYVSDRQLPESAFDAYTHVRPLSKIKISPSDGKLTNLFSVGGNLYAHTTERFLGIPVNRTLVNSDKGALIFGQRGFLSEPTGSPTEGFVEGYAGLRRHNEAINTQYGYFFVDAEADVIYRFSAGSGLETISSNGMFNFFKEYLNFCNPTECIDERRNGTAFYSMGVDPRFNRFLITKNESDSNHSFTLSYDLGDKIWLSHHDYMPRTYIWDRRDMYTLASTGGIWRHNSIDYNYRTFYGKSYPSEIQFTAMTPDAQLFELQGLVLHTEATKRAGGGLVLDLDITFNKMAMWNSTQGTGTMPIELVSDNQGEREDMNYAAKDSDGVIRANKSQRFWHINDIHDYTISGCEGKPMALRSGCTPFEIVNEGIFSCSDHDKQDFENKVILDKYAKFRFTYDGDNEIGLDIISIQTFGKHIKING